MNEFILMILRAAITVTLFALFVALIFWAWSPKRRKQFDEAANLVFDDADRVPAERVTAKQEPR
jgi:cytochrome c oxidase cbb3-type subunit 4